MTDSNFNNGCVLIVGGSGGIGSLCAQEFANSGAKVAITYYKNEQAAIDIANEINADVKIYQLDNSDPTSVEDTFKKVISLKSGFEGRSFLPISLSYDHRAINGVYAVQFTSQLGEALSDNKLIEKCFK